LIQSRDTLLDNPKHKSNSFHHENSRLVLSCLVAGCEKTSLELSEDRTGFSIIDPLPDISLSDLEIKYKEGVPFFEDARAFSRAHTLVSRTSQSEYLKWANSIGFRSDYFNLIAVLERAEKPDYRFTKEDMKYALPLKEGGAIQHPYHRYSFFLGAATHPCG
jgi:hypothetical protein